MSGKKQCLDKRERRLPSLLVRDNCTKGEAWNRLSRTRYRLRRLREDDPAVYANLLSEFFRSLDEIEQYLNKRFGTLENTEGFE